jgi:hypothetical protein
MPLAGSALLNKQRDRRVNALLTGYSRAFTFFILSPANIHNSMLSGDYPGKPGMVSNWAS